MKRKTFEEILMEHINGLSFGIKYEEGFERIVEHINHQEKRIADLEGKLKTFENTGMIGSSPAQFMEKIKELEIQNALLEKCRAFYAEEGNYINEESPSVEMMDHDCNTYWVLDRGNIARETLIRIKNEKD